MTDPSEIDPTPENATLARLARRPPRELASFIASLAHDLGPIGEQVRTFLVADDPAELHVALQERIRALRRLPYPGDRQREGAQIGERLDYLLDSIERHIVPGDPHRAFELLTALLEADGEAMERCGDYDFEVSIALKRAVRLIDRIAQQLPATRVRSVLQRLLAQDGYGTRRGLSDVLDKLTSSRQMPSEPDFG